MAQFFSKLHTVEATQWWKNGDHPKDDVRAGDPPREGKVVRYFRHPCVLGNTDCEQCEELMHAHGWLDKGIDGDKVCPGDWIVWESGEYFVYKPDVFKANYTPVEKEMPKAVYTLDGRPIEQKKKKPRKNPTVDDCLQIIKGDNYTFRSDDDAWMTITLAREVERLRKLLVPKEKKSKSQIVGARTYQVVWEHKETGSHHVSASFTVNHSGDAIVEAIEVLARFHSVLNLVDPEERPPVGRIIELAVVSEELHNIVD